MPSNKKYVLVEWEDESGISVLDAECVIDKEMLNDKTLVGMVVFAMSTKSNSKNTKNLSDKTKKDAYFARVLFVSGK